MPPLCLLVRRAQDCEGAATRGLCGSPEDPRGGHEPVPTEERAAAQRCREGAVRALLAHGLVRPRSSRTGFLAPAREVRTSPRTGSVGEVSSHWFLPRNLRPSQDASSEDSERVPGGKHPKGGGVGAPTARDTSPQCQRCPTQVSQVLKRFPSSLQLPSPVTELQVQNKKKKKVP